MRTRSSFQASQFARINPPSVGFAGFAGIKFLCSTFSHSSNLSYRLVRPMMGCNTQNASESNPVFANVVRRQLFHPLVLVHTRRGLTKCATSAAVCFQVRHALWSPLLVVHECSSSAVVPSLILGNASTFLTDHRSSGNYSSAWRTGVGHLGSARSAVPPSSAVLLQLNTRGRLDPNVCHPQTLGARLSSQHHELWTSSSL